MDENHYNAWWGLGNIAMKQENYQNAQRNFKDATQRNERSAQLWTYLGMTYHNCSESERALKCFDKADKIDSRLPL